MALAGACGEWDPDLQLGFADPARVVLAGGREFDAAERELIDREGVTVVEGRDVLGDELIAALGDDPVFVHLDLDVLDPDVFRAKLPVDGGLTAGELRAFLAEAASVCTIVGAEVTAAAPGHGEMIVDAIAPLLA
jgi:arginase family enzyme